MRRIWIGVGILLGLLVLGILVMQITDRRLGTVSDTLQQAAQAQDWNEAASLSALAQRQWKQRWHLMASLADHTDMDAVDSLFAQLEVCRQYKETAKHAALCARLSEAIRALEENHRLTWWNLL